MLSIALLVALDIRLYKYSVARLLYPLTNWRICSAPQEFKVGVTYTYFIYVQGTCQVLERSDQLPRDGQRFRECRVFIFEQIIIISEPLEKPKDEFSSATYLFKRALKASID